MICYHCGKEHPLSTKFCPYNGKPIEWTHKECPNCGKVVIIGARFCPFCQNKFETVEPPKETDSPALIPQEVQPSKKSRARIACGLLIIIPLLLVSLGIVFSLIGIINLNDIADTEIGRSIALFLPSSSTDNLQDESGDESTLTSEDKPDALSEASLTETQDEKDFLIVASSSPTVGLPSSTATSIPQATFTPIPTRTPTPTATITATPMFSYNWKQGHLVFPVRSGETNDLYIYNIELDGAPKPLYANTSDLLLSAPAWSPDGTLIAFNYYLGDMYVLDVENTLEPRRISGCGAPSWSPDSTQITCSYSREIGFDVFNAGTGELLYKIGSEIDGGTLPYWSPQGNEIVYVLRDGSGKTAIWKKSLTTKASPILIAGESTENYAPAISPDGDWIAFQSNLAGGLSEIWVIDRNGNNLRQITYTPEGFWSRAPAWSPDGKWLAYVSNQAGGIAEDYGEAFVVSLETGDTEQITQTSGKVYDWRISWGK